MKRQTIEWNVNRRITKRLQYFVKIGGFVSRRIQINQINAGLREHKLVTLWGQPMLERPIWYWKSVINGGMLMVKSPYSVI